MVYTIILHWPTNCLGPSNLKQESRSMSLSKIAFAFSFAAISGLAIACSGNPDGSVTDETADNVGTEELHNSICGGIAGIPCPTGYQCQLTSRIPNATGKRLKASAQCALRHGL